MQSGQDLPPEKYNSLEKGIPYITGASNIEDGIVLINRWTEHPKAYAYKGDILLTCKGTVGTMAVLNEPEVHVARQIMAIKPTNHISTDYVQIVLLSLVAELKAAAKSMIPGIGRDDVLHAFLPLPPREEQERIVTRFKDINEPLGKYDDLYNSLEALNNDFPDQLKKSILQQAVQGKLVPQDFDDEPASVLLERVRAEKERLIAEGKIKRDKNESIIYRRDNSHYEKINGIERCIDDEIPFDIPDSWVWTRIGNVFSLQAGKNIQASEISEEKYTDSFPCYGGNGLRGFVKIYNHDGDYPLIGRQGALCGNINRANGKFYATEHAVCVETFAKTNISWVCLFLQALNLNQYATATAQPGLAVGNINKVFICRFLISADSDERIS